jgi:hypothetical protein
MNVVDEDNLSRPQGRVVIPVKEDQHRMSMAPQHHDITGPECHDTMTLVQQHRCNDIVPQERHLRGITHIRCIDVVRAPV